LCYLRSLGFWLSGAFVAAVVLVLIAADEVGGGAGWAHHPRVSAAPLILVAGAIAAVSVAHPAGGRHALNQLHGDGLLRVALKMATGAGKIVVIAMVIAWQAARCRRALG
jgi:hypothetical protein